MKQAHLDFISSGPEFKIISSFLKEIVGEVKTPQTLEQAIWVHLQSLMISEPQNKAIQNYYQAIENCTEEEVHPTEVILESINQSFSLDIEFAKYLSVHDIVSVEVLQPLNWVSHILLRFLQDLRAAFVVERKAWVTKNEVRIALKPRFEGAKEK